MQRILLDHGYHPEPEDFKRTIWAQFLKSHWNVFCAVDFFSIELLTTRGLIQYMVLFVMDIATRRVQIAGIHYNPNGDWIKQVARNLTDSEEGILRGKRFLILDRNPLFTKAFKEMLKEGGVTSVPTAVAAPMMNAHAERFVRAVKYECLNKLILTKEAQLRYALGEYIKYYHHERFHKGLGRIIEPIADQAEWGKIICLERLGGLLESYHRRSA